MKSLRKLSLSNLVAAVAAAGLSLSAAYAAPSYSPDVNSPINTPDGGVDLSAGLSLINAQLTGTETLILPAVNGGVGFTKPTKPHFLAAVRAAAALAASDADKAAIVRSALFAGPAYGAAVTKDVVRQVLGDYLASAGYSQAGAILILDAALTVNNGKSNDVMAGAILAIGDSAPVNEAEADEYAAGALAKVGALSDDQPKKVVSLIEGLAEQAIKNMKANSAGTTGFNAATLQATVNTTAAALIDGVEATGSVALLSNVAKGIVKGSKALASNGVTLAPVYAAISAATAANADSQSFAFVGVARTIVGTLVTEQDSASLAFGNTASIIATKKGYFDVANSVSSARVSTLTTLVTGDPANAAHYITGAVSIVSAIAGPGVAATIALAPDNATKIAMVAAASRASNSQAAKAAGAAAGAAGGLSVGDALSAALSNTPAIFAGSVAKEVTKAKPTATEAELVTASIDALEAAASVHPEDNFKAGIIDVIAEISKIRKTAPQLTNIIAAGIGALPAGSGYAEAVAVAIGRQDKAGSHAAALTAALTGIGASSEEVASVLKADEVAKAAKTNTKGALNLAQTEMRTGPVANLGGILLAAGAVDKKLTNVLLANALRLGNGSLTTPQKQQLLAHAKSVNKSLEGDTQLAYNVATLVLADPDNDNLFEIVDHAALINPKGVATVATAAAAAAPKYAHYVARAAAFRAGTANIAKVPLAVIQGADMNSNLTSNPSAVAAISAAFICGIKDAKATTLIENKMLTAGMTAMVKAAMGIGDKGTAHAGTTPPSGTFASVNVVTGILGASDQPEYGSAAAVTGLTSILSNLGDALPSAALIAALTGAGKAVGKAANNQSTVIAQAAMQAFVFVTGTSSNAARDAIVAAIVAGSGAGSGPILAAANAGRTQALIGGPGNYGAGAAGVVNYAHFNCNNGPVTDIAGF
jgi:hypothetical protein